MNLTLRKSNRKQAKMKLALAGPSGSGKTMSALLIAMGLAQNWNDIAVLDTENGSADLYAHLGEYNIIPLSAPYSPEQYIKAIDLAEKAEMKVLIIDSLSHCWEYLLEVHSSMSGNTFSNWSKITPRQNALIQRILNSNLHIISTLRTKQDYVLSDKNGRLVPEKVGLKTITRDGVDYEFTLVFDIDIKHKATASKDRTGIFADKPQFTIGEETGKTIKAWCEEGSATTSELESELAGDDFSERIGETKSVKELVDLYRTNPAKQNEFKDAFTAQKRALTTTLNSNSGIGNTPAESFADLTFEERRIYNG